VSALVGVAAIASGIPVKEFSFGDTLIGSGATALVGGLILIGLGAAVAQLQRIAEFLGARPLSRAGHPVEPAVRLGSGAGRVPFPPKPKAEPRASGMPVVTRVHSKDNDPEPQFGAPPSLRNPDVPLMADEEAEQLPLSPRETQRSEGAVNDKSGVPDFTKEPPPPRPNYFDKMWPSEPHTAVPPPVAEPEHAESIPRVPEMQEEEEPIVEEPREEEAVPVAVLKSGVVDGMGYTLYVDGSIEAELPDGTLRFASINELRAHLEKNS
jgi:hypothetical protein